MLTPWADRPIPMYLHNDSSMIIIITTHHTRSTTGSLFQPTGANWWVTGSVRGAEVNSPVASLADDFHLEVGEATGGGDGVGGSDGRRIFVVLPVAYERSTWQQ